ncbi:uncharacterized protein G2W53_006320 [Senna tora]|uniref:SANT domain-containing protein n=1 Tax=Senna tora TaxID=362788 RepID=A0A834X5C2_9FABA|nr:uncharacterized protein G2W53_006320 [Senna tora]
MTAHFLRLASSRGSRWVLLLLLYHGGASRVAYFVEIVLLLAFENNVLHGFSLFMHLSEVLDLGYISGCEVDLVNVLQVNDLVNCIEEQADEQSLSPEGSDIYNAYGDSDIFPRVGEQYQVEIPTLMSQSDYCWFQKNTQERTAATPHDFLIGLPIPIVWIKNEVENKKRKLWEDACKSFGFPNKSESSKLECKKESRNIMDSNESPYKHEVTDCSLLKRTKLEESGNINMQQKTKGEIHENHKGKGYRLVPGSSSDTWNEIEEASFILGLYIFGKNLVQVTRFIGSRKMGDILSFYYGKFYKSDRYRRWSECRKMRSRKCIYGQKIFTGARQQELLSRLLPNVSEKCYNNLLEASKTFTEGKMLLEDYVLSLKTSVGLNTLVEAVGIGKGKEDLTGMTAESLKSTQALPARPEIPVGKACSMLTPAEIITFLTGDFRLSKARSSDLFWEAVWPRLLARGWHSEQPGSHNYALPSKNSLVFLVPGVKKFSRKLVKGHHYFDSVSDVLGKVASDPELIELEAIADKDCRTMEENGWTKETNLDRENSPDQQRHCYLKPRTPNRSTDVMKFTVVDTSLADEKMTKVRELRSLPVGVLASTSEYDSDEDTSEDHTNESESTNTMCFDRENVDITGVAKGSIGREVSVDINGFKSNPSRKELRIGGMDSTNLSFASKNQKTDLFCNMPKKNATKCQSSPRMVHDNKNVLAPVTKRRRRLTACSRAERNCNSTNTFVAPRVKEESICFGDNSSFSANTLSRKKPLQQNKVTVDPPSYSSSIIGREAVSATSSPFHEDQHEKPLKRTMIDLNLPVSPEAEADEPFMTERQQNHTRENADDSSAAATSKPEESSEQPPNMNTRRHSTRNRPLTAKVLEAFALGYLDNKKEKRKSRDYPRDCSGSRPSRRVRGKKTGETSSSSGADFQKEERTNAVCNGIEDVISTGFKSNETWRDCTQP